MKIIAIRAVLGLSFFGSVKGSLDALKPNRAVIGSFETTPMGTLGHTKVVSEALEVSNFQRKLALTFGSDSCVGGACNGAGEDSGSATVGSNSCTGTISCSDIGRYSGEATIGSNSCLHYKSCHKVARNTDGKATIGDDSCHETNACVSLGASYENEQQKSTVTVGNKSCRGEQACYYAGYLPRTTPGEGHSQLFIGDNSCNGKKACNLILYEPNLPDLPSPLPPAKIGNNSCNCESCCTCLIHGDIVPDDSCNSRGTASNQCCEDRGDYDRRNSNFNFDNAFGDTVTDFVAPAEFDVTLSTSPGCAFTAGTDNIGTITCTFDTKGAADYTVYSALYSDDCSTGAPTGVSLDTSSTVFNPALVSGTQYNSTYVVTLPIANSAAAAGSADIVFCLKTEVKDKNGDVYDWTNQKITKPIDVNGNFSTEDRLSTVTFTGGDATDKALETSSYGVGINRCDENGDEVSNSATLAVGENFFLCVKGSESQVVVSNIGEMTANKTDITDLSIVTKVDDGSGEGTSNSNTFVYGNGQNQVVIATRLPATFFASNGAVTFSGSANIVVGDDARRRLSRSMQVASASSEESASFSMDIQVVGMDDASSASAIKTTAAMFFVAAVAALIV